MNKNKKPSITFAIPAFNEAKNLKKTIDSFLRSLKKNNLLFQIVIVNDGSTDNTRTVLNQFRKEKQVTIIHLNKNRGLGHAIQKSIEKAKKKYFFIFPADGDIEFKFIKKYLRLCSPKKLLASYFVNNKKRSYVRRVLSCIFNTIYIQTFSLPFKYINGPAFYPTKELKKIQIKSNRFSVVAEINVQMVKAGLAVQNIAMKRKTFDHGSKALKLRNLFEAVATYVRLLMLKHEK